MRLLAGAAGDRDGNETAGIRMLELAVHGDC
jgi:hypothetical protein